MQTQPVLAFGPFEIDHANRVLRRDGEPLGCTGQRFDLLVLLASNAGRLVSRDRIQRALWPNRTIEFDLAINGCVRDLRRILGDGADSPQYIKTVPKHGYIFVGTARKVASKSDSVEMRHSRRLAAWLLAALLVVAGGAAMLRTPEATAESSNHVAKGRALFAFSEAEKLFKTSDPRNIAEAGRLYRAAVTEDAAFGLAWAGLADVLYYGGSGSPSDTKAARAAAERALSLQPDLARAMVRKADILFTHDWDFAAAGGEFRRALAAAPADVRVRHSYAAFLLATGEAEQAVRELEWALSIDPLSAVMTSDLSWTLSLAGRHREALEKCAILRRLAPENPRAHFCPLRPLIELGQVEKAGALAADLLRRDGQVVVPPTAPARLEAFWRGRTDSARNPFSAAVAHARLGNAEGALEALARARAERNPLMPFAGIYLEFRALRPLLRFQQLTALHVGNNE